ncbi:hypothetical protein CAEBREN_00020 [Caenorhabditis brenneri]|uniref:Uncharacterized protein n=1 Tax=Caenorhabditis brenneri TaxID=135651 RepID=G0PBK5_CAEBE|nr:hypothetical protein CAEBREN_00020 [Caenorhabditis brenneri]
MEQAPASPEVIVIDDEDEPVKPLFEVDSMYIRFHDPSRKKNTVLRNRMAKHLLPKELEVLEVEFRKRGCDPKDYLGYDKKVASTKEDEPLDITKERAEQLEDEKDWLRAQTTAIKNEVAEIGNLERATKKSTRRLKEHTASRILAAQNSGNTSRRLEELKKMKELSDIGVGVPKFSRTSTDRLVSDPHGDPTERKWVEAVNAARNDAFKHPYMWYAPECFFQETGPKTVPQLVEPVPGKMALFKKNRLDKNKNWRELDKESREEMNKMYFKIRNMSNRQIASGLIVRRKRNDVVEGGVEEKSPDDRYYYIIWEMEQNQVDIRDTTGNWTTSSTCFFLFVPPSILGHSFTMNFSIEHILGDLFETTKQAITRTPLPEAVVLPPALEVEIAASCTDDDSTQYSSPQSDMPTLSPMEHCENKKKRKRRRQNQNQTLEDMLEENKIWGQKGEEGRLNLGAARDKHKETIAACEREIQLEEEKSREMKKEIWDLEEYLLNLKPTRRPGTPETITVPEPSSTEGSSPTGPNISDDSIIDAWIDGELNGEHTSRPGTPDNTAAPESSSPEASTSTGPNLSVDTIDAWLDQELNEINTPSVTATQLPTTTRSDTPVVETRKLLRFEEAWWECMQQYQAKIIEECPEIKLFPQCFFDPNHPNKFERVQKVEQLPTSLELFNMFESGTGRHCDWKNEFEDLFNLESSDELKIWILKINQEKWAKAVEDAEYLSEKHPEITFNNFYFFKPTGPAQLPQKVPYVPWPKALFNQYMELFGNDILREYDEAAYIKFCCVRRWLKREQQRQIDMGRIMVEKAEVNKLKITVDRKYKKIYSFDYVGRRRCLVPGSQSLQRHNA